jgi:hypothetical protein
MILITRLFGGFKTDLLTIPGLVVQSGGYDRSYPAICRKMRPRDRRASNRIFPERTSISNDTSFTNDYV